MRVDRGVIRLVLVLLLCAVGLSPQASAKSQWSDAKVARAAEVLLNRDVIVRRGDSLASVLARAGFAPRQRLAAEKALRERHDIRHLMVGSHLVLTLKRENDGPPRLIAVHIEVNRDADLTLVASDDGSFDSTRQQGTSLPSANTGDLRAVSGVVGPDFATSMLAAGIPSGVVLQVRQAFVYDPDFPSRPPSGSRFDILFDPAARSSDLATSDALHSVTVTILGRQHSVYRYPVGNGLVAFVAPNGRGTLQAHLAEPVPDARISSPWGWRIHPVLERPEFHKGVDMAAPMGTPVHAAADGTIAFAGWHGNYGMLVKVEHSEQLLTTYGHLERVASGLHAGSHVVEGQVIGYVGDTGLSTGPHLYYEVVVGGERINPAKDKIAVPIRLVGAELWRFRRFVIADARASLEYPSAN